MKLRELGAPPIILSPGYEFHYGASGNSIENSKALKYKVEELIESKAIIFEPNGPNVNNNPMPP